MRKILLVDIDGTIARIKKMAKFPTSNKPEELDFIKACQTCEPIKNIVDMVQNLEPFYDIVLLTARPEYSREATMEWLLLNDILQHDFKLIMRPDYDLHISDNFLKVALLFEHGIQPRDVALVIDDNPVVIQTLRDSGYFCVQVKDI